jgi:nucleolar protein 6
MSSTPKLTKRQKKGIAFREGKGKGNKQGDLEHDVPVLELQDLIEGRASGEEGGEGGHRSVGGKGKGREEVVVQKDGEKKGLVVATKKRKREVAEDAQGTGDLEGGDGQSGRRKVKRTKGDAGTVPEDAEEAEQGESKTEKSKQRFILFLGMIEHLEESFHSLKP